MTGQRSDLPAVSPDALRYPLGRPTPPATRDKAALHALAAGMLQAAQDWRRVLEGCSPGALAQTYRPGAWTVHGLAHHVADAHLHGLVRLGYGLTEPLEPGYTIQPMDEGAWLALPTTQAPVAQALALLDALNGRWVALLRGTDPRAFDRVIVHPQEGQQDLWQLAAKHEWHLRHHLAHVRQALAGQQAADTVPQGEGA